MFAIDGSILLREARRGSPEAVSALLERYGPRLHLLIRARLGRYLRRRLESRDILQATLLQAFQDLDRFEGSGSRSLMAWLGTIAVHEIRDQAEFHGRLKRDAAREYTLCSAIDPVARQLRSEVSRLQLQEETEQLEKALDELREEHREILLLRGLEELSFPEVAERLGKSPDACRMLYARAKAALALKM